MSCWSLCQLFGGGSILIQTCGAVELCDCLSCPCMYIAVNAFLYLGIDMFDKEVDVDGEKIKMYIW